MTFMTFKMLRMAKLLVFRPKKQMCYQRTDQPTNQRTDIVTYRVACTRLKTLKDRNYKDEDVKWRMQKMVSRCKSQFSSFVNADRNDRESKCFDSYFHEMFSLFFPVLVKSEMLSHFNFWLFGVPFFLRALSRWLRHDEPN